MACHLGGTTRSVRRRFRKARRRLAARRHRGNHRRTVQGTYRCSNYPRSTIRRSSRNGRCLSSLSIPRSLASRRALDTVSRAVSSSTRPNSITEHSYCWVRLECPMAFPIAAADSRIQHRPGHGQLSTNFRSIRPTLIRKFVPSARRLVGDMLVAAVSTSHCQPASGLQRIKSAVAPAVELRSMTAPAVATTRTGRHIRQSKVAKSALR